MKKKEYLPGYKVMFWCDQHEKWLAQNALAITDKNIDFHSIKELLKHRPELASIVFRELVGYANYASASDALRLIALDWIKGLYSDVDIEFGDKQIQNKNERVEHFIRELADKLERNSDAELLGLEHSGAISNAVIFAKGGNFTSQLLNDLCLNYYDPPGQASEINRRRQKLRELNKQYKLSLSERIELRKLEDIPKLREASWVKKRYPHYYEKGKDAPRLKHTFRMTGPDLSHVLYKENFEKRNKQGFTLKHKSKMRSLFANRLFNLKGTAEWANTYHTNTGPKTLNSPQYSWATESTNLIPY
jgi:hypothetical protein